MLITVLLGCSQVYFETGIGAKISQFSYGKIIICLLVVCMVAKNVFIPSRATRFLENSKDSPAATNSSKLDKAKLKKLPGNQNNKVVPEEAAKAAKPSPSQTKEKDD